MQMTLRSDVAFSKSRVYLVAHLHIEAIMSKPELFCTWYERWLRLESVTCFYSDRRLEICWSNSDLLSAPRIAESKLTREELQATQKWGALVGVCIPVDDFVNIRIYLLIS